MNADNGPISDPGYGAAMLRPTQRAAHFGRAVLFCLAALAFATQAVASGCTPVGGPPASATPAGPGSYPGWPPLATYELVPVPVSSELAVGDNRFLLNLLDAQNQSLVSADRAIELRFFDLAENLEQPASTAQGTFMSLVEGRPGLYRAQVTFDSAGDWGVEAVASEPGGSQRIGRMIFTVRPAGTTPQIGGEAPASETPTAATDAEIAAISTDEDPDPDFYRQSVAGALEADEPFLVVFATPAFCTSATCGPALDIVKSVAPEFKESVTFIHVEPYQLQLVGSRSQPVLSDQNLPIPVDAVNEWGLPTEPYIFVVDSAGNVSAKFEGVAAPEELRAALESVSG